jgi:hypothetical protein
MNDTEMPEKNKKRLVENTWKQFEENEHALEKEKKNG